MILANVHLLATSRGGCEARRISEAAKRLRERYGADVILFDTPAMGISSTDIRARCKKGSSLRYLVPAAVEEYLTKHGCYRELLIGD